MIFVTLCAIIALDAVYGDSACTVVFWRDTSYAGTMFGPFEEGRYTGATNTGRTAVGAGSGNNVISSFKVVAAPFTYCRLVMYDGVNFQGTPWSLPVDNRAGATPKVQGTASMTKYNKLSSFQLFELKQGLISDIEAPLLPDSPLFDPNYPTEKGAPEYHVNDDDYKYPGGPDEKFVTFTTTELILIGVICFLVLNINIYACLKFFAASTKKKVYKMVDHTDNEL
eukprot:466005_1